MTVLRAASWLLLAAPAGALGAAPAPQAPAAAAEVRPAGGATQARPADSGAESAAERCYRAARGDESDPYVCDLAVQVARNSGSRPALAAALTNRALVLERQDHLDPALADLQSAIEQTPDDPALHGDRGNLLLRLGRPGDALDAYDRAVELAPDDPRGYFNRAFGYRALGQPERAAQDVQIARSLLERAPALTDPGTAVPAVDLSR